MENKTHENTTEENLFGITLHWGILGFFQNSSQGAICSSKICSAGVVTSYSGGNLECFTVSVR